MSNFTGMKKRLQTFAKTLNLSPNHADALEQAGFILSRMEKYEEAIALFDRYLNLGCSSVGIQYRERLRVFRP